MAVMARIVGIPARVASGYADGAPGDDGLYHINEGNAHSWPESYFGDLGWIEFEPTSARPEISRPSPSSDQDASNKLLKLNPDDPTTRGFGDKRLQDAENQAKAAPRFTIPALTGSTGVFTIAFLLMGLAIVGTLSVIQIRWQRQLKTLKPGAQAAAEMYRFAKYAGMDEQAEATPDERAQQLAALLPNANASITNINTYYVHERYGARDLPPEESANLRASGIAVQKQMWRPVYMRYMGNRIQAWRTHILSIPQRFTAWWDAPKPWDRN